MVNEQFSLMQLILAVLSSGLLSSGVTYISSRKQILATTEGIMRDTYGQIVIDLRGQIAFLNEQIKTAQEREVNHLSIIAQQNSTVNSLQAELTAGQINIRNLEAQKHKLESKLSKYENQLKWSETHS